MSPIVFLCEDNPVEQAQWLAVLRQSLPHEDIRTAEQFSDEEAQTVAMAIMTNPDGKQLQRFDNLIWIHSLWAGIDRVIETLPLKGVKLVRLIDPTLADTMAEAVLAWTLYLQRNMPEYAQQQAKRQWRQLPYIAAQQTRVSVAGTGKLGIKAITALNQQGYSVSCWSRSAKHIDGVQSFIGADGLKAMVKQTDILICLLPSTPQTHQLINGKLLDLLPKGAKLINFARGAVLDTDALVQRLNSGQLSHAVLDVFTQEPLPVEDELWHHPKITILPHISAQTNAHSAAQVVADNVNHYRDSGIIPESVDLERGY